MNTKHQIRLDYYSIEKYNEQKELMSRIGVKLSLSKFIRLQILKSN
jgi:hypothetical protein